MRASRTIAGRFEQLESRHMLSATVFESNGIAYFLNQSDPGFARYDIAAEQWLPPIDLAGATGLPTEAHADSDGIYVAYGKSVYRYDLDGSDQTPLLSAQYDVLRLHSDGNLLFVNYSSGLYARLLSINKSNNTLIDSAEYYVHSIHGSSIDTESNRIFGRSQGVSPSDITYVTYNDEGNFLNQVDSPYHGDFPGGSQTWVFDDHSKVVDSSGTIYNTALQYVNSFGTSVTDVDFVGGQVPIVLSGSTLTAYSAGILPTGSTTVSGSPSDLFVNDENAIVFEHTGGGWVETIVPLSELSAPVPGEAIDPENLPFTPDKIEIAADGTVLLFSKQHASVFRYDPDSQTWGDTIPLIGSPLYMAYSAANQKIYLAYDTGLIRQIDLASESLEDTPFATLPSRPYGVTAAGEFLFAADPTGAWESHHVFGPDGSIVATREWTHGSLEYVWNATTRRMYYFTQWSPRDIEYVEIGTSGALGNVQESPLHDSAGFSHPIRVSPDGGTVVLGSGVIHNGTTLARLPQALGNSVTDIAWLGADTYTIRTIGGVAQLQTWSGANWGLSDVAQLTGTALSLTAVGPDRLLAITSGPNGVPMLTIVDGNLNVVPRPVPVAIAGNDVRVDLGQSTTLNATASYDPDQSPAGLSYSWRLVEGPGAGHFGNPTAAVTSFTANIAGDYLIELTVSDGQYQSTDTLVVTYRLNLPPIVSTVGSATSGIVGRAAIQLTAAQSTDPNGDLLSFNWELIKAPNGATGSLSSSVGVNTALSANTPGAYEVRVTANDGSLETAQVITINFAQNQAPTADVSLSDLTGVAGRHPAVLDARASTDPEGDSLTYFWEILSGPNLAAASITNSASPTAQFQSTVAGVYQLRLTASDGLDTDSFDFEVTIDVNQSPVADASRSVTEIIFGAGSVRLDGTASSDPDDTQRSFSWRVVASSNSSTPSITFPTSAVAFLNPTQPGVYAVELTVSDGVSSDQDYVLVTVIGNQTPQADASASDAVVVEGIRPRLDASRSFDPDGDLLSYSWTVVASSTGTLPEIEDSNAAQTRLQATDVGSYAVRLVVDDGSATSTDFIVITVRERFYHAWTGDFNGDGWVDAADYSVWRDMQGMQVSAFTYADSTGDGWINTYDYDTWRSNFGSNPGAAGAAASLPMSVMAGAAALSPLELDESNVVKTAEPADSAIGDLYSDLPPLALSESLTTSTESAAARRSLKLTTTPASRVDDLLVLAKQRRFMRTSAVCEAPRDLAPEDIAEQIAAFEMIERFGLDPL